MANNNWTQFEEQVPDWKAQGAEPREELKETGFQAGYRPPAGYFNWFWTRVSRCLKELQEKWAGYVNQNETEKANVSASLHSHTANLQNPHRVTAAQLGLGSVDNTADSQKRVLYANSAGSANSATSAVNASHASSATNATNATTATHANHLRGFWFDNALNRWSRVMVQASDADKRFAWRPISDFFLSSGGYVTGQVLASGFVQGNGGNSPYSVRIGSNINFGTPGLYWHDSINTASVVSGATNSSLRIVNLQNTYHTSVTASAFHQASSRRYKKNIVDIQDELCQKILQLRPVIYQLNNNEADERQKFGLIAEEVEEILPEMVTYGKNLETEAEEIVGLDYQMLLAPMLHLLQTQKNALENLQNRIQTLEALQEVGIS